MICGVSGTGPSSANSAPVNNPSESGSMPSATKPALGTRSKVTGNCFACSRKGTGSSASVASTSAKASACSFFQSPFIGASASTPFRLPRLLERLQGLRVFLKKLRQVRQGCERSRAEMMFEALDVRALRVCVQAEQGEEARECGVAVLDFAGNGAALVRQTQATIFFILHEARARELLHHGRHRGLPHFERGRDVRSEEHTSALQ